MLQRAIKIAILLFVMASIVLVVTAQEQAARQHFHEALQTALDAQLVLLALSIVVSIGELLLLTGQRERSVELLALTLHHPASDYDSKERARRLLTGYRMTAESEQCGETGDFNTVTAALLDERFAPKGIVATAHTPQADQTLIEPLSKRELEVVSLIADGLSNQEIADRLILSVGTVKWHTSQIYCKLGVQNRAQAVRRTQQLNLLCERFIHNGSIKR